MQQLYEKNGSILRISKNPKCKSQFNFKVNRGFSVPLRQIDRKLIDRTLKKEPGSWNELVDRYIGLVYHIINHVSHARSIPLSAIDVEDICAEVFTRLHEDNYAILRSFRGNSSLPTFMTVALRRVCIKELVRRQREQFLGQQPQVKSTEVDEVDLTNTHDVISEFPPEEIERLLEDATEEEVEILRLRFESLLTPRQIAKQLQINERATVKIIANAERRLSRKVRELEP